MAGYLGQKPAVKGLYTVDEFTSSGGTTYTLSRTPGDKNNIQVSAGGLVQYPSAYSVSGTTLTLSGVPSGQKVIVRHFGDTTLYPYLDDDSVTLAKMASGTDGNMITYDASGNPAAVATGTAGQVLTSAGAGAPPTFAAAAAGGKIGQVLQAKKTDTQSSSTAGTIDITGLSIAITPSATTSKILVTGNIHMAASTFDAVIILFRGATEIGGGAATGSSHLLGVTGGFHRNVYEIGHSAFCHLDTPNTTSATTYKLSWRTDSTVAHYVNRTVTEGSGTAIERVSSDITVWEILA